MARGVATRAACLAALFVLLSDPPSAGAETYSCSYPGSNYGHFPGSGTATIAVSGIASTVIRGDRATFIISVTGRYTSQSSGSADYWFYERDRRAYSDGIELPPQPNPVDSRQKFYLFPTDRTGTFTITVSAVAVYPYAGWNGYCEPTGIVATKTIEVVERPVETDPDANQIGPGPSPTFSESQSQTSTPVVPLRMTVTLAKRIARRVAEEDLRLSRVVVGWCRRNSQSMVSCVAAGQRGGRWHQRTVSAYYDASPVPEHSVNEVIDATSLVRVGAICRDGWISSAIGTGTCSHHDGVRLWLYRYS